jgi:DNA topoisomerase-1
MGSSLVIVESPAKARTIEKYLGEGFRVEASVGHIRDLPENAEQIPASKKKLKWARLGVNTEKKFQPLYVVPPSKKSQVKFLKDALKDADALYLATDEDREGESIAWHLMEVLKPKVPVKRLVFNEITRTAIQRALKNTRDVDLHLVRAQETRRIVDRLYGYEVSPLLWKKIRPKLSAGRVQSVAVRLVVERERRRLAFTSASWWDAKGIFTHEKGNLDAELWSLADVRLASGRDFGEDGTLSTKRTVRVLQADEAKALVERLTGKTAKVTAVEEKPYTDRPAAPFTTSTLQQDANRKLRFTARRTMSTAQRLYENGWITYMRTDSTTLSGEAVTAARGLIKEQYGARFLPNAPRTYSKKSKNAQEAHEAIRPAGQTFRNLERAKAELGSDEFRLYSLIWKRTVASQMVDAKGRSMRIEMTAEDAVFQSRGRTIDFPGYRRAYVEGSDDPEAELADQERLLPPLVMGDQVSLDSLDAVGHQTKAPARLTEASLVKELEAKGIGRPSTYASIIDTILRRKYVFKKGSALVPTFTAFAVTALMENHLGNLVDYDFTARMEDRLDEIAVGNDAYLDFLERFYRGQSGLQSVLNQAADSVDPRTVCTIPVGQSPDGQQVDVRVGRYGPFLNMGDTNADIPDDLPPDELTLEMAVQIIEERKKGPKVLGVDPTTDKPVYLMKGRFGPYVQLGDVEEVPGKGKRTRKIKPPRAGMLRGMDPETLDFETAMKLLALPRDLGPHPETTEAVLATNGPYGPYVKSHGKGSRSIPAGKDLFTFSLAEALDLLAKPARRRGTEPLKQLGPDPLTGREIRVMSGRWGPYVTDGETNATLPPLADPLQVDIAAAVDMIRKRENAPKRTRPAKATKSPAKKTAKRKPAAKKTTAKKAPAKKATAKKATAKKATAKKAPAKKAPAKKATAKKATAKKATAKKATAKKTTTKK